MKGRGGKRTSIKVHIKNLTKTRFAIIIQKKKNSKREALNKKEECFIFLKR